MDHVMLKAIAVLSAAMILRADAPPTNPVFPGADPDIGIACNAWWIYPTTGGEKGGTRHFYAWRSPDLVHWTRTKSILDLSSIDWAFDDGVRNHGLWAPGITRANGKFYLYYSMGPQAETPSRLGVAVSDHPGGPFVDSGKPLLTGGNGFEAIDPMVFIDPKSGTPFLYAGGSAGATLRVFTLKPDMTEIAREIPVKTPPEFTEGSYMHERDGTYYLSYSHGRWNGPDYSVHYATAPTPTGPWTYRGVLLKGDATHQGPGHHAFILNPATGEWFIVYHRWERSDRTAPFHGSRSVAIQRIHYGDDGKILPVRMTDASPPASLLTGKNSTDDCNEQ